MKNLLTLAACLATFTGLALPQAPVLVEGTVVNRLTGEPVPGATVNVYTSPKTATSTSDSSGHFQVTVSGNLPENIAASRPGYCPGAYPLYIRRQGSASSPLRLQMTPESVIWGAITDEDGFPVADASVQPFLMRAGRLEPAGNQTQSNDLGEFRVAGLEAGGYYLRVALTWLTRWDPRYAFVQYYPGGLRPGDGSLVEVRAGEKVGPLEFHAKRQQGVAVVGRLQTPKGVASQWSSQVRIVLLGSHDLSDGSLSAAQRRGDGTFRFPDVPPGTYVLLATNRGFGSSGTELYGERQLVVSGSNLGGIELPVHVVEPADVAGTVVFEGGAKHLPIIVSLLSDGVNLSAKTDADGAFVIKGIRPGSHFVTTRPDVPFHEGQLPDIQRTSMQWGNQDIGEGRFYFDGSSNGPLRITYAPASILTGRLLNAAGTPVSGRLLGFSPGPSSPYMFWARTSEDGSFTVALYAAGAYRVFLQGDDGLSLRDSAYLHAAEGDFPTLRILDGHNVLVTLRLP